MEVVAFPQVSFIVGYEQDPANNGTTCDVDKKPPELPENSRIYMSNTLRNLLLSCTLPQSKLKEPYDNSKFNQAFERYKLLGRNIGKPLSEDSHNRGYSVSKFSIDRQNTNFQINFQGPFGALNDYLVTDYEGKMIKLGNPKLPNIHVVRGQDQKPTCEYRLGNGFRLAEVPYNDLFRLLTPVRLLANTFPGYFENIAPDNPYTNKTIRIEP